MVQPPLGELGLTYVVRKCSQIKLPPRIVKSRCFKNFSESDFIDTIKDIDWNEIHPIGDANEALHKWQTLFTEACDKHAPFKEKKIKGCFP